MQLPETDDKKLIAPGWAVLPTLDSWTWPEQQGKALTVETYAKADRVQLLLNGKVVGEQPSGVAQQFRAKFQVPYQPGKLTARAVRDGKQIAETSLETVGAPTSLRLSVDRNRIAANGQDLAFVTIEAVDAQGRVQPNAETLVSVTVEGPGSLAGLGNGTTKDNSSYTGQSFALFHGRALAVIRTTLRPGTIRVTVSGTGISSDSTTLVSKSAPSNERLPSEP